MARQPSGRHPLAAGSLVLGLCFCGIALLWLLSTTGVMTMHSLRWAVPVLLVTAGVVGVLASLRRDRSTRSSGDSHEWREWSNPDRRP